MRTAAFGYRLAISMCVLMAWLPTVASGQSVQVLHSFKGCILDDGSFGDCSTVDDGSHPRGTLVEDAGVFYGTTFGGGSVGVGTIFKIAPNGSTTQLFRFQHPNPPSATLNGTFPVGLLHGSDGAFYGGTDAGGVYGDGVLFKITADGTFTKLHDFDLDNNPSSNGGGPYGGLVFGPDGLLYGTTQYGGLSGYGTVFRRNGDGTVTTLHNFSGTDGQWPQGDLMLASDGYIYGTTWAGGGLPTVNCGYNGCGTVFRFLPPTGAIQVVHAFTFFDGYAPSEGRLVESNGKLYGLTALAGAANSNANGTFFSVDLATQTFSLLHSFTEVISPRGTLALDVEGNLYGTASGAGLNAGSVFQATPSGTVTVLHNFGGADGRQPLGGLVFGSDGDLYGTTNDGGLYNLGVVFRLILPKALNGELTVTEDTPKTGNLTGTDPNSDPLTFTLVSNGAKGTASVAPDGSYTYTPNLNQTGTDSFTFRANNGTMDTNIATVSVTITPVNDAPVATNGTATTPPGTQVAGTLNATDVDSSVLTFSIVTNGAKGTAAVTNATTGAYTYTAQATASGTDTFTFKASDGALDSNGATITVTIAGNAPPVASNSALSTKEDRAGSGRLSAADPEGQPLTFSIVSNPSKGTVTLTSPTMGRFTYTPQPDVNGTDTFTFRASDGLAFSSPATVTVTITALNDAPVAVDGSVTTHVNQPVNGTLQATDVDGDTLTYSVARAPRRGTVSVSTGGAFTYTPAPGFVGSDVFKFRVVDPAGLAATATISVAVSP
jgi:uncharacterized repeat protein (TIGR03803 family)/VCBS repeat-containing protein